MQIPANYSKINSWKARLALAASACLFLTLSACGAPVSDSQSVGVRDRRFSASRQHINSLRSLWPAQYSDYAGFLVDRKNIYDGGTFSLGVSFEY